MVVGVGSWKEEAFVTLDRGIMSRRRWLITEFVHSAVNGFWRPGGNREMKKKRLGFFQHARHHRLHSELYSEACKGGRQEKGVRYTELLRSDGNASHNDWERKTHSTVHETARGKESDNTTVAEHSGLSLSSWSQELPSYLLELKRRRFIPHPEIPLLHQCI